MEITRKIAFLVAGVAVLAVPLVAQSGGSASNRTAASHAVRKHAVGEAASLESKEGGATSDIREDNHGRITAARRPHHAQDRSSKAIVRNAGQKRNAAHLQTGQLTTRQTARFKTTKTTVHNPIRSKKSTDSAQTPDLQDKSGNTIHLKQHNARMF